MNEEFDEEPDTTRLDQLREMLKAEPQDVFLHYAIMLELKKVENLPAALMQCYELLDIDPGNIPTHYQMALLFQDLGQPDDAIHRCERGLALATEQRDLKAMREFRELMQRLLEEE